MDVNKLTAIATSMISFTGSLGVLFAMLYYLYQVKQIKILIAIFLANIYILINLIFLYIIRKNIT